MSATSAVQCQALRTCLAAIVVTALSACASSIQIQQPAADSVITVPSTPAATRVVVTGNDRYTGLRVTVDGTDVSNQMVYQGAGSNRDEGNLTLPLGRHTVVARAEVPCWYCQGQTWTSTDTKSFCLVPAGAAGLTKTAFAQADNSSWSSTGGANASYAPDAATNATRWRMTPAATGIGVNVGVIESVEFPCKCLRSPDDNNNSVIALALCDRTDQRQQWRGIRRQTTVGKGVYSFESVASNSFGCLTEQVGGTQVIQRACDITNVTPAQLWTVRNNTTNAFETDSNPWGQ
ncbi:MAG: RICIN domain-containing protein [Burkholderiaceae bacterium]